MSKWIFGVAASVIGTFSSGLGDNLVRKSYAQIEHLSEEERPPPYKRPLWVTGWLLTTVMDTGCNALALALAPLSLIIPLGALHILWGAAFAHLINEEPLGKLGIVGAVTIVAGVALVLVSAPHDSKSRSFDDTLGIMGQLGFVLGQAIIAILVVLCLWLTWCAEHVVLKTFAAPAVSGLLGSSSNLMLKIAESLASSDGAGRWEFWLIVLCTVCLALAQLMSLNHALATGEAFTVVPTANSVLLIGGTVNGLVCFNDSSTPSQTQLILLSTGIVVVVAGIGILAGKKSLLHLAERSSDPPLLSAAPGVNYHTQQDAPCAP
eukprot:TRINITY_DN22474_c0_g1_i1.p1 TRINITY_DN22474_c0_g1~~TRINITY_DN22474_c0_g1_i1.p1  ORF type:complete len:321 (+),score=42.31 TRINITY_DN22474_c0_g1_i1:37-999(+)